MRELARADIRALLQSLVDVVVQCGRDQSGRRVVSEILYREAEERTAGYRGESRCGERHGWDAVAGPATERDA